MDKKVAKKRQKRSHDGCLNCKDNRIKCDRQKPSCRVCLRRGLNCNYNKRLKWLNSSVTGNDGYVPPKLDNRKDDRTSSLRKRQVISTGEKSCADASSQSKLKTEPVSYNLLTTMDSALFPSFDQCIKPEPVQDPPMVPLSNNDYLTLKPSDMFDEIFDENTSPSTEVSSSTPGSSSSSWTSQTSPPSSPVSYSDNTADIPHHKKPAHTLQQGTSTVDQGTTDAILHHYLSSSCHILDGASKHPMSKMFYMHLALRNSICFNGLLAISASQLATLYPEYQQVSANYRSLSLHGYLQVTSETIRGSSGLQCFSSSPITQPTDNDLTSADLTVGMDSINGGVGSLSINNQLMHHAVEPKRDVDVLSTILCQLQLDNTQPQSLEWSSHLSTYRYMVAASSFTGSSLLPYANCGNLDQEMWFVNASIAKFDTFACLKTGSVPLVRLSDDVMQPRLFQELDAVWSLPSRMVTLCAEISLFNREPTAATHAAFPILSHKGISASAHKVEKQTLVNEVSRIMQKLPMIDSYLAQSNMVTGLHNSYMNNGYNGYPSLNKEQIELSIYYAWTLSTIVYYYRTVEQKHYHDPLVQTLTRKLLHLIAQFPADYIQCTGLSWPTWVLVSIIDDQPSQILISNICSQFSATLKSNLFNEIAMLGRVIWNEMTYGIYAYHNDYQNIQHTANWCNLVA